MLRYTLRQLEYFVTAAERGSVARAAAELNVSQPSVSTAVGKLEQQFGVQLFIRQHAQGVLLTPVGRRLLAQARLRADFTIARPAAPSLQSDRESQNLR